MVVLTREALLRWAVPVAALAADLLLWNGEVGARAGFTASPWVVVVIWLAAYAVLAIRHRPLAGYGAVWLFAMTAVLVPRVEAIAGLALALYRVARTCRPPVAIAALMATAAPAAIYTYNAAVYKGSFDPQMALVNGSLWIVLFGGIWLAGKAFGRGAQRLRDERAAAVLARAEAVRTENLHISRELHDILAHALTGITMRAAGAVSARRARTVTEAELERALVDIQETSAQSMRELHRLLGLLRAEGDSLHPEVVSERHTLREIDALVATGRAAGLDITLTTTGRPEGLDPSIEHAVYRVIQEGLANAMKNTAPGSPVVIQSAWRPGCLEVTVTNPVSQPVQDVASRERPDSGTCWPEAPLSGGFGLLGLRERMHVIGGTLHTDAAPDRFVLRAVLPTTAVAR